MHTEMTEPDSFAVELVIMYYVSGSTTAYGYVDICAKNFVPRHYGSTFEAALRLIHRVGNMNMRCCFVPLIILFNMDRQRVSFLSYQYCSSPFFNY